MGKRAGVTPKQFLQYLNVEYAKRILRQTQVSLLEPAFETDLSGTVMLHDLFVRIEGMTPGEYKNGGEGLTVSHSVAETPIGSAFIASTWKGVCNLEFADGTEDPQDTLMRKFSNARFCAATDSLQ